MLLAQLLLVGFHHGVVVGHVIFMPSIAVKREPDSFDIVLFEEAYPEVLVLSTEKTFIIEPDVDELLDAEHDTAGNGVLDAVPLREDAFVVVDDQVIARDGIYLLIHAQMEFQYLDKVTMYIIITVYPDDELTFYALERLVERGGQPKTLPVVDETDVAFEDFECKPGAVRAAIIDHDDFTKVWGNTLAEC